MLQCWSTGPLVAVGLFIPLVLGWPRTSESSKSVDVGTTDEGQRSSITTRQARRLVFRKSTLAEMAAEFNRYNLRLQIHVKDEVGRSALYSAVFDADSPESLLDYLAGDSRFTLRRTGINVIVDIRPDFKDTRPSIAGAMSRN